MRDKAQPRPAATVILLREAPKGFETFLTRRPKHMPFLGGMYCFPGGLVTQDDSAPPMLERCRGLSAERAREIAGAHLSPRQALGFWVAAVRELFEETGILLALDSSGAPISPRRASRLIKKHHNRFDSTFTFLDLLQTEQLYCDLSNIGYLSHWQTPAQTPLRFDTLFFVTALPLGQSPLEISAEVVHSVWLAPERAMQRYARGELPMIFPTFASLRTLADFASVQAVMKEFGNPRRGLPRRQANERGQ